MRPGRRWTGRVADLLERLHFEDPAVVIFADPDHRFLPLVHGDAANVHVHCRREVLVTAPVFGFSLNT